MGNQFANAFVRQMGRECAHATFKEATTNYNEELRSVNEKTLTMKFIGLNYGWFIVSCILGLFFPFIMMIPFIVGAIRLFSNKVWAHYKGVYSVYKQDGRCRGGQRYCGEREGWIKAKLPKESCTESQILTAKAFGLAEMLVSLIMFILLYAFWVNALAA